VDRSGYLAVSDLLNHAYCGRITWFAYVLGVRQRGTVKTEHGARSTSDGSAARRAGAGWARRCGRGPSSCPSR